jgi:hypothetical protein
LGVEWDWVNLVRRPLFGLLYRPRMMDVDECGAVGGLVGRGNRSTRSKPVPVPLCPPKNPTRPDPGSNRAAAVRSQRLTARATARPSHYHWWTFVYIWRSTLQRSDWSAMLRAGSSLVRFPMRSLNLFSLPNPSIRTRPWSLLRL